MVLANRVIPCLDCDLSVPNGRVVKGRRFREIRYAGVPWELAQLYYEQGADEICFLDITASAHRRETMVGVVEETCKKVFVPVIVGGGVKSVDDAKKVFRVGADKVSINTAAIKNPMLVKELSRHFGSQAVVVAIDAKERVGDGKRWWECSIYGGTKFTGLNAVEWAKRVEGLGAGEILLTSMDKDGTREGFDLALTRAVVEAVNIPVIASGGAGSLESIAKVFVEGKADAALAASVFHFGEFTVREVKEFLKERGIAVRL